MKIAVAGAPSTGKNQLAAALSRSLKDSACEATVAVAGTLPLPTDLAGYELTLLMGLEEPSLRADKAAKENWQLQQAADQLIRAALAEAGIPYRVMYGTAEQRLARAFDATAHLRRRTPAITPPHNAPDAESQTQTGQKAWVWACEKCSDPGCEHRLLSDLLAQRGTA